MDYGHSHNSVNGPDAHVHATERDIRRLSGTLCLLSLSVLTFEIALLRVFSIILWYHFGFLVISVAMLGIGASGTVLHLFPRLIRYDLIPHYCILTAITIGGCPMLLGLIPLYPAEPLWNLTKVFYTFLYSVVASMPFLFFGMLVTTVLTTMRREAPYLYGADLLGAALGAALPNVLLWMTGPGDVILFASITAVVGAVLISTKRMRILSVVTLFTILIIWYTRPVPLMPEISPYKPLSLALRYPDSKHLRTLWSPYSRVDVFKSPIMRTAPGLSLTYQGPLPEQLGIATDGQSLSPITIFRNREELRFLEYLPMAIPYNITKPEDVLVIDPEGGLDVLIGMYHGAERIHRVESNPLVIQAVREFSGPANPYSEMTWRATPRSWLSTHHKEFDIISLSLLDTLPSGGVALSEDYRLTTEAFQEYLGALKEGGILSITVFIIPPPRMEFRIINTAYEAMQKLGLGDIRERVAIVRSLNTITILVSRSPLSLWQKGRIREFCVKRGFDILYMPGFRPDEWSPFIRTEAIAYQEAFQALVDPQRRVAFLKEYLFDVSPVDDSRPFAYYFLKLKNLTETYYTMSRQWHFFIKEGYLLPVVTLLLLILATGIIMAPLLRSPEGGRPPFRWLSYFAIIGIAYMFVEVSLFESLILPLENPSYAGATAIGGILLGSAAGSALVRRTGGKLYVPFLLLSGAIVTTAILLPSLQMLLLRTALPLRAVYCFILALSIGFLMGMPFPAGLLAGRDRWVPWAWAINGSVSVVSPPIAIMLALLLGFRSVLFAGALLYLVCLLLISPIIGTKDTGPI